MTELLKKINLDTMEEMQTNLTEALDDLEAVQGAMALSQPDDTQDLEEELERLCAETETDLDVPTSSPEPGADRLYLSVPDAPTSAPRGVVPTVDARAADPGAERFNLGSSLRSARILQA